MPDQLSEDESLTNCCKQSCTGEKKTRWIKCSVSDWIRGDTWVLQLRPQHSSCPVKCAIRLLQAEPRHHCDQESWIPNHPHITFWVYAHKSPSFPLPVFPGLTLLQNQDTDSDTGICSLLLAVTQLNLEQQQLPGLKGASRNLRM